MDTTELTEEINLCVACHSNAGLPTIVDFPDSPFATCETCGADADDTDLVSVKREDVE